METIKNPHQAQDHFILPESDKPLKEPTIKLTQEQIDFFKTNGFLSIDRLIDDNEVAHIRDQYDQVNISLVYLNSFFSFSHSGLLLKLVENMEIFLTSSPKMSTIEKQLHHNFYGHQSMVKI
jgi:hypothetical protein